MIANILTTIFEYIKGFVLIFKLAPGYTYGLSIILFTVIIKVLLLPINIRQSKSQAKMQELQTKLQEIQSKYKNDPKKQQEEKMKLYQEAGTSPFGGCLPPLIQMPIFVAMYALIRELGQEISGLSFTFIIPDLGKSGNLPLTVLYAVTSYFSMMIMMPKNNLQTKTMGTTNVVMTVFSAVLAYSVAAGLGVYLFTSSVFAVFQNLLVKKLNKKDEDAKNSKNEAIDVKYKTSEPNSKGSSKKKGKK